MDGNYSQESFFWTQYGHNEENNINLAQQSKKEINVVNSGDSVTIRGTDGKKSIVPNKSLTDKLLSKIERLEDVVKAQKVQIQQLSKEISVLKAGFNGALKNIEQAFKDSSY